MINFKTLAQEVKDDIVRWRHDFHAYPELSFHEVNTSRKIAEALRKIGYTNVRVGIPHCPETGAVADLNPGKPGRCIVLRADMDALPIQEETSLPYTSQNHGVAHACGHDSHMAMLLGAAKILFPLRSQINGNIRFIFQPGEEYLLSDMCPSLSDACSKPGARILVEEDDVMDGVDAVFGIHVWGTLPSGVIHYVPGPFMTTNLIVNMEVTGVGGHGAMPHTCIDPVVAACQIISAWQTIISREIDPQEAAVLTVGSINVDSKTYNVIPERVSVIAGARTYDETVREYIKQRMQEIAEGVAKGMRVKISFTASSGVPPVRNDEVFTMQAVQSITEAIGAEHVACTKPVAASEDFSWYQKIVPGALMFLGVGNEEKHTNFAQHHPQFNSDDEALPNGTASLAAVAYGFINQSVDIG